MVSKSVGMCFCPAMPFTLLSHVAHTYALLRPWWAPLPVAPASWKQVLPRRTVTSHHVNVRIAWWGPADIP